MANTCNWQHRQHDGDCYATHVCAQCNNELLCAGCAAQHGRMQSTRTHQVQAIPQAAPTSPRGPSTPPRRPLQGGGDVQATPDQEKTFVKLGPILKDDAPRTDYMSHMRIDPTLSRHSDLEMQLVRRVYLRIQYEQRKTPEFAPDCPDAPKLAMREARFRRGRDGKPIENIFFGLTQLTKTPEIVWAAWCSFFILGCVAVIFVRNKGGAVVGSEDMAKAILDLNDMVERAIKGISEEPDFSWVSLHRDIPRFTLKVQRTSEGQSLEFTVKGLTSPQVVVACMNANQIKGLYQAQPKAKQPFSLWDLLNATHVQYRPYPRKYDEPSLRADAVANPGRCRLVLLCDEDDLNRSSFKGENAIEKSNWNEPDWAFFAAADALSNKQHGHDAPGDADTNSDEKLLRDFRLECDQVGLRNKVYGCISITATPVCGTCACSSILCIS
jgi:hypothetical protein